MSQNLVGSLIKEMTLPKNGSTNGGPGRERFFFRYVICSRKRNRAMREMRYGATDANVKSIFNTMGNKRKNRGLKQRRGEEGLSKSNS